MTHGRPYGSDNVVVNGAHAISLGSSLTTTISPRQVVEPYDDSNGGIKRHPYHRFQRNHGYSAITDSWSRLPIVIACSFNGDRSVSVVSYRGISGINQHLIMLDTVKGGFTVCLSLSHFSDFNLSAISL